MSLMVQTLEKNIYEIIIIDGGSTDTTKDLVKKYKNNLNIDIISSNSGLSEARNLGCIKSKGDIVAFLDDDAIADNDWLNQIIRSFNEIKPEIFSCGGKVDLIWESNRPSWLSDSMLVLLGKFDYGDEGFLIKSPDKNLGGLNMAFHKKVFEKVGLFNTRLGRTGGNLLSNEEVEFFQRMREKNLKIYYNPKMLVHHHVTKERTKKQFFFNRYYWQGRSDAIMSYEIKNSYPIQISQWHINLNIFIRKYLRKFVSFRLTEQNTMNLICTFNYYKGYLYQKIYSNNLLKQI